MTSTPLHLAPDPADVDVHALRADSFRAAHLADAADGPIVAGWHFGIGIGITYGLAVGGRGSQAALNAVASYRQSSYAGAADALTALDALSGCYIIPRDDSAQALREAMARRAEAAQACGVMRGFKLATAERRDATECRSCGTRVLTDLEDHELCGEHGIFCGSECRQDYCTRSCYVADGPLTSKELRGDA
jgi:hypothetical protein